MVDVGLGNFAAICGLTEREYGQAVFDALQSGRLLSLLKPEAKVEVGEWILERMSEGNKEFVIAFRFSLNRGRDVGLFCVCSPEDDGESLFVRFALPGMMDKPPAETKGLGAFEICFCDLVTNPR
jgi:hypothetical protein